MIIIEKNFLLEGKIWRLFPKNDTQYVWIEIRNADTFSTYWACLDTQSGSLLYNHFNPMTERWWVGTWGVEAGIALLYRYANPQQPTPEGITAIDIAKQHILWRMEQGRWLFYEKQTNSVWVAIAETNTFAQLHLRTGAVLKTQNEPPEDFFDDADESCVVQHYSPESDYFNSITHFLAHFHHIRNIQPKNIQYIETATYFCVGFWSENNYQMLWCSLGGAILHQLKSKEEIIFSVTKNYAIGFTAENHLFLWKYKV